MKKLTIFLIILFVLSCIWLGPDNVENRAAITDRFLMKVENLSEKCENARYHITYVSDTIFELKDVVLTISDIPDQFENAGTLAGIFSVIYFIASMIKQTVVVPIVIIGHFIFLLVDLLSIVLALLDFLTLFAKDYVPDFSGGR